MINLALIFCFLPLEVNFIYNGIYICCFNKCMHLYTPSPYQDIEHNFHPRKFPHLLPNQYLISTHNKGNCQSVFSNQNYFACFRTPHKMKSCRIYYFASGFFNSAPFFFLRFIHVVTCIRKLFIFFQLSNITYSEISLLHL